MFHKRFFSAFDADGLEAELHAKGVERLVIAGVHSHACIQATALDAYARGFDVADRRGSGRQLRSPLMAHWRLAGSTAGPPKLRRARPSSARRPAPWQHRNPCNSDEILFDVEIQATAAVSAEAERLRALQPLPLAERADRLHDWHQRLTTTREQWVDALIRDLGKPRGDAEGEVAYGLGLLAHVAGDARRRGDQRRAAGALSPARRRRSDHAVEQPFRLPIAKLAPALGLRQCGAVEAGSCPARGSPSCSATA